MTKDDTINHSRRTAVKALGAAGTAIVAGSGSAAAHGTDGDDHDGEGYEESESDSDDDNDEITGHGRGKWACNHHRQIRRDDGEGYERDFSHDDHDTRWDDWDDDDWRDGDDHDDTDQDEDDEDEDDSDQPEDDDSTDEPVDDEPADDEPEDDDTPDDGSDEDDDTEDTPDDPADGETDSDTDDEDDGNEGSDDDDTTAPSGDTVASQIEARIHEETNAYREKQGLEPLSFAEDIGQVARNHSEAMAEADDLSHDLNGDGPGDRLDQAGIDCQGWAENIAYEYDSEFSASDVQSVADSIVQGWVGSDGHRRNIVGEYSEEGIGVYVADNTVWATQMFCSGR